MMLQARNATVTMCHTRTRELAALCRNAEILIVAAGKAGVVDASFTNPGQIVIDVGINAKPDGGIYGDVNFEEVEPRVKAITPVPGGVGSVTTAVLCKHVIEAAERIG
jgi:methylenetetrahydrofolate dehydrogenase (NADP+)/methenyltetrahydrofolate cyclohydrolase